MSFSKLKNTTIGVLGIGYIGSNILNFLKALNLNLNLISIDRESIELIETIEFDYLINASGNSGDFRTHLIETIDSNLGLNQYILAKSKIKKSYIYLSSSRVYGFSEDYNIVFDELSRNYYNHLNLDFIYDGSKQLAESLLFNYAKNLTYNIGILRLSNVYGKFNNFDDSTLIKKIIRYKATNKECLSVKYNRHSTKDYIHVNDVAESIVNIMLNIEKTDIYNLAYGQSYSLDDISKFLALDIKTDETLKPIYSNLSNEKLKNEFKIKLKYNFEDELKKITLQG